MEANEINLLTICKGAVPEAFAHELAKILANIADPTTSAKKTRKITLEITFEPYPDRSGASTLLSRCESSLGALDTSALSGTIHIAKRDGKYLAFSRDLRQELLFTDDSIIPQSPQDGKTAAGGQ